MGNRQSRSKNVRSQKNAFALDQISLPDDKKVAFGKGQDRRFVARIKPRNPKQEEYMAAIDFSDIVFGIGPAGTGKTFIAVCLALEMLASNRVRKIILSRPAIEAEGEKLGFLPGDLNAKIEPYLMPIYDILKDRVGNANMQRMIADGLIELCPLGFMRGRTFDNAALVLDEMQNATNGQLKMALTRIGEGTKAIVTGDPDQNDLPPGESGLLEVATLLEGAPGIESVRFANCEVIRSSVVRTVLERL